MSLKYNSTSLDNNQEKVPSGLVQRKNRPVGCSEFGFGKDCVFVFYIPKIRKIFFRSPLVTNKIDEDSSKPDIGNY